MAYLAGAFRLRVGLGCKLGLMGLCALSLQAATYTDGQNVVYTYSPVTSGTGTASVVSSPSATGTISIPASITTGGFTYTVTNIGLSAFLNRTGLTSVTIPASVTSITAFAFSGCTGLTSVVIPSSVSTMGQNVFSNCISLTSVTISGGMSTIPAYMFRGCTSLTSVTIPSSVASIGSVAFYGCTALRTVTIPTSVTSIDQQAFSGSGLTSVIIPSSVTRIGTYAFSVCPNLSSVTIPSSVTSIPIGAFMDCPSLTSMTISSGVTSIGDFAFNACPGLTSVTIPGSVTSIGSSAFTDCTGLTSVTISTGVTSILDYAFSGCTSLTSVTIPSSIVSIGEAAFYSCTGLTSVTIPSSVTSIGASVFFDCVALTSVTIPSSVTSIGPSVFSGCPNLTSVTIPSSVTSIGDYMFYGCTGLTSVTIPSSIVSIGEGAFYGCTGLTNVMIPSAVTSIGASAFFGCAGLTSMTIPTSVMSIEFQTFSGCTGLTSVTISNGVSSIFAYAFEGCIGLTSLTIPSSITSIGIYAFARCTGLTSTTIPSGITLIDEGTFAGCTGLTSITIPSSVTSIDSLAFPDCTSLTRLYFLGNAPSLVGVFSEFQMSPPTVTVAYYHPGALNWTNPYKGLVTSATLGTSTKIIPTITVTPTASGITYGQSLASSTLSGGTASTAGTFTFTSASTAPAAGTASQSVTFTPADTTNYTTTTTLVNVIVAKATPTISATPTASGIAYGQTLASSTLSGGTASLAGTFTFTNSSDVPGAGTASHGVTFTPSDTTNYTTTTTTVNVTVAKITPTITAAPTASGITYGQTLASSTLSAGTASVAGTFTFSVPSTAPIVGTASQGVTFTPSDTANYNTASGTVSLVVNKATPTVTWASPSAITYGTVLSATQLNASGSVAGAIVYSPASGTTPSVGTQTLTATFTPTDTANYNTASGTVSLVVNKATPTVTWASPSAITYGTTLSATQLNATASVPGTFAYSPASGTTPSAGLQTLMVTFTPTDTANYSTTTATVALTVTANKATPTLTWATPDAITYGTTLTATQLNASGSVVGAITYSPASGTTLNAGAQTLTATFTPTDTANYITTTGTVSLVVNKATPTLTWSTPSSITYGTTLSATQLNASGSVPGTIAYSPASGAILSVGTQTLSATFTPTDTVNYSSTSTSVSLNVIVAVPSAPTVVTTTTANGEATVIFTAPSNSGSSAITGYTIRATAPDGSVVTVNASGSPAQIIGLTPGKAYRFTVTANNSAGSGDTSISTDPLTISLVNQTITFTTPADREHNSGSFALSATASSGLPVTYTILNGPALLTGNIVDLTGAHGPVVIRASQAGNVTYAAAPYVDRSFLVTEGPTRAIFSKAINPTTQKPEADLVLVLQNNSHRGFLMIVSPTSLGLNGVVAVELGTAGVFTADIAAKPAAGATITATPISYTVTGSLTDNILSGTVSPLGLTFRTAVVTPENTPLSAIGCYEAGALGENTGSIYAAVGAKNELLVLIENDQIVTGGLMTLKADNTFSYTTTTAAGTAIITGDINPVTTVINAKLSLASTTPVSFSGLNMATTNTDRLINLSSRAKVGTGEAVLITGFVVGGPDSKRVLIRAVGPALSSFGLANALPNPTIKIYQGSNLIAQNDDWNKDDAAEIARLGAFAFPAGSKDAALLTTLAPGAYTAQISDPSGTGTGVALAEIYDASVNPNADYQRLVNISSRGKVTPDDGVLIGGFIVTGNHPKTLLIRGIGPALLGFGIAGALADPALTIYQDSKAISTNEGWANSAAITTVAIQTGAFALPSGSKDAAVVITLNPGAYTAQIKSAKNASSGVALIEIYEVP